MPIVLMAFSKTTYAQCPPNIDFEQGDYRNWALFSGSFNGTVFNELPATPIAGRHDIITAATVPALDPWGNFPKLCPNGSGYSVRMGLESTGTNTDRATYTFTIPAGQNSFSLIYNYAIVINNTGGHPANIQPRLIVTVKNITDNTTDTCASFDIAYSNANPLPGFQDAPSNPNIKFKPWAANSIDLNGNAGKTIEISFTATGCGAGGGTHFGYAYVDINSQCQSSFIGAAYCPDDTSINVTAPFGYQFYQWWDPTFTINYGSTQTINFTPPPPSGLTLKVILTPYDGYGCIDTLTVTLTDTLNVFANAGPDRISCERAPIQLGVLPTPGFIYSWSPVTNLSNPNISNPIATPSVTTTYVLTAKNFGGGCLTTDTVTIKAAVLDTTVNVSGPLIGCITPANPTILKVGRGVSDSIQWYRNNIAIPGANDTVYNVVQTGAYHVTLFSFQGCNLSSTAIDIFVNPTPVVDFGTNALIQCFNGHQFNFTNNSTIAFGTMNYDWNMGDGSPVLTTRDVSYSYADTGTYIVRLIVTSDQGCIDSVSYTVKVYESPFAAFDANTRGICQKINDFIFTNNSTLGVGTMTWLWDFGDGNTDTTRIGRHYYRDPGTYTVRLTATTEKGCPNDSAFTVTVFPEPQVGFNAPNAQQCFGNNQFNFNNTSTVLTGTMQYNWYLGDGASTTTRDVTYSYAQAGDYMVKMVATTDSGCVDSTAKNIKIFKYAIADFKVEPVCVNQRLALFNQTVNTSPSVLTWLWEFGNGATSTLQNPVYSYPAAGNYPVKLTVSNIHCPQTLSVKQLNVTIDQPLPGIRYPDVEAVMNFPEQLQARQIANSVLWIPSVNLDFSNSYRPSFKGLTSQLYQVQLKTNTGCITVDTQFVQIKKKIQIYVPTAFTPGGNGLNEFLYPVLMGFKTLNYFRVYDRWGKVLFQTKTERPGWDGRLKGEGVSTQTVVWMVEAVDVDGVVHRKQGTTIILR